jgi:septum formation protein
MPDRTLILASGSPARRRLLTEAGFDPKVVVSGVPEDDLDAPTTPQLTQALAVRKASAVATTGGDAVVLGCDSMLEFDGRRFGKPVDNDEARGWLRSMRGRQGTLYTGHCVIDERSGRRAADVAGTVVRFGSPTEAELDAYLATGEALQVAGAFTLDGRSAPFIDGVDGDPGNVIGLSMPLFRSLLIELGLSVTQLWAP